MIIDQSYFFGKLSLPQTSNTEGRAYVDQFITSYEPDLIKQALGYELWKAFTEGIEGSGIPDDRWVDLLQGKEFTYRDRLYFWNGFQPDDKLTPIANYVYYRFMEDKANDNTLVGSTVQNVDNNSRVNGITKMIDAWNNMADMLGLLYKFLCANSDVYPEWKSNVFCKEIYHYKNSLDL